MNGASDEVECIQRGMLYPTSGCIVCITVVCIVIVCIVVVLVVVCILVVCILVLCIVVVYIVVVCKALSHCRGCSNTFIHRLEISMLRLLIDLERNPQKHF